jgi:hypothetical protein
MGSFSVVHWAIVGIMLFILGFPTARILNRLGFSRWWVVLALIPYVNVVGLWVLAFKTWPIERQ